MQISLHIYSLLTVVQLDHGESKGIPGKKKKNPTSASLTTLKSLTMWITSEVRGSVWEELHHAPMPEARGGGWEDQPHIQGAVAAQAQEGLEALSHVEGQEGWW